MNTVYFRYASGNTLYVKRMPLNISVWTDNLYYMSELETSGSYSVILSPYYVYEIYEQAGSSPSSTDSPVGSIDLSEGIPTASQIVEEIDNSSSKIDYIYKSILNDNATVTTTNGSQYNPRISGRVGQPIKLNVDFYNNGQLVDPYAVRYVEIYKSQVLPHNLVTVIPFSDIGSGYPLPAYKETATDGTTEVEIDGKFYLPFTIPDNYTAPELYYDVWYYFAENPCADPTEVTSCDIDSADYEDQLLKCCHRFWVYPDEWFCNDGLQTVRFAFEPLDQKFHTPEARPLEIGLMPLPLYDYNHNLVTPIIPFLNPTITIETQNCEVLQVNAPCEIGLRQGSYRSNPWVVKYNLDTTEFLKGTYRYQITLNLPDGSTRVSKKFIFTIS